ncbi:CAP domain-containing protein [Niastella populi]|uniref:CAP domain-containing protein n=1 Tax=Niastella populi TaxID=550983 RepID=UPI001A980041|nr:CAP domain-containing protein [Niastella populi]
MKHVVALALLFSLVVDASSVHSKVVVKKPYTLAAAPASNKGMADEILKYINDYRRKKGLPALSMNASINAEAQRHSENMAARRTSFSHNGFQGRIKRISSSLNGGIENAAENVAMGSTSAQDVVNGWLTSSMHKRNIEGHYNLTGIGVAADKKGVLYFTQIFVAN